MFCSSSVSCSPSSRRAAVKEELAQTKKENSEFKARAASLERDTGELGDSLGGTDECVKEVEARLTVAEAELKRRFSGVLIGL